MAEVLRTESDTDHRYQVSPTDRGFLLSSRQKSKAGPLLGPSEWMYQTQEAAEKGLRLAMLMNAWWTAITRGYPIGQLPQRCEAAAAEHKEAIDRLNDEPLIGMEVRNLRLALESSDTSDV